MGKTLLFSSFPERLHGKAFTITDTKIICKVNAK